MKDSESIKIQLKAVLALRNLFNSNIKKQEDNRIKGKKDQSLNDTIGKVSNSTGLRRATISDTLNGKTIPNIITVGLIIMGLGKDFQDFTDEYNKITDVEINKFKLQYHLKGKK